MTRFTIRVQLVNLIKTARQIDSFFNHDCEKKVLEDFKHEIDYFLGGILPSKRKSEGGTSMNRGRKSGKGN